MDMQQLEEQLKRLKLYSGANSGSGRSLIETLREGLKFNIYAHYKILNMTTEEMASMLDEVHKETAAEIERQRGEA